MTISNATIEKCALAFRKERKFRLAAESEHDADCRALNAAITALLESGEVALTNNSDPWEHCNNIGKEKNWGAVCIEYMKPLHDQNGGDEPSGDALSRAEQPVANQWKPIESAPRDGTWVRLKGGTINYGWDGDSQPSEVVAQFTHYRNGTDYSDGWWQYAWYDGGYYGAYDDPTHWMPLPKPPQEK